MIRLIFCKDKAELKNISKDKEVICLGLDELFFEAYEELDLSDKIVKIISLEKYRTKSEIQISNRKMAIMSLDNFESMIDKNVIVIVTAALANFLENETRINDALKHIDIDAYLYHAVRNEMNLTQRSIERQKKILCKKNNMSLAEAKKTAERLIDSEKIIIPKLNILVTDRCTLSCKDCRALVPMTDKSQDEPLEKVIKEIDAILDVVDGVVDIEPIGGEPFLYPFLPELLEYLCLQDKIMNVCISTNATVIPSGRCLETLRSKKIFIYVSDYGYLEKMARFISVLESADVSFVVESNQKWSDVGGINYRNRDIDNLKKEYMNCYGQFMVKYVWDNKIWLCPRAPRLKILNVINSSHDCIDIFEFESKEKLQETIINTFFENYAESCNYCDQGDVNVTSIPAGLQQHCDDKKSRFTIVDRDELEELLQFKNIKNKYEY